MRFRILNEDFWEGMPGWQRLWSQLALGLMLIALVSSIFMIVQAFYKTALIPLGSVLAFGTITWLLIGERLQGYWRGEGWKCPECSERVGYSDQLEAFRVRGMLGDIPNEFSAFIVCYEGHATPVDWRLAWLVMMEALASFAANAKGNAVRYKAKKEAEEQQKHLVEKKFSDEAFALVQQLNPGEYMFVAPDALALEARDFACRPWPRKNRNQLYRLLAVIESYAQVQQNHELVTRHKPSKHDSALISSLPPQARLYIEDIDSFAKVRAIDTTSISHLLDEGYLDYLEEDVQIALEEILDEPFHKKDWGGEINDLYTSNVLINGTRVAAAFLLKGRGLKSKEMKIRDCGENGDQLVRLFDSPCQLFVVQFVGNISEAIIKDVAGKVNERRLSGHPSWFCIINGQDTARLLHAYGKL